ncbi:MAG: DUF1549 domain-containing protein, partial [Verrucomicrobiota bacterium]
MTLHPKASGTVPSPWRSARIFGVLYAGMMALGGVAWPTTAETTSPSPTAPKASEPHWAYQPLGSATPPSVRATDRLATPVDAFIQASLEARGQSLAPAVDSRTWLRRVSLDLIGLPPTFEQIQRFQAEDSPVTRARVIDELLANPRYGERWGRHWLDVARYADTAGDGSDYPVREAGRYRDWVVSAFNNDLPFNTFIRQQIAGDILAKTAPPEQYADLVTATGFLAIGKRYGYKPSPDYQHLDFADAIDSLGRSLLGMSLGCARCHD